MKTIVKIALVLFAFLAFSCDDGGDDTQISELQGTKWKVIKIIEKATAKETLFPEGEKNFELIFRTKGKFNILNGCNYSYGKYETNGTSIHCTKIGVGTEVYCGAITDFENIFITTLSEIKSYEYKHKQLLIISDTHKIVLEYAGKYDLTKGKVLFVSNGGIADCPVEIELEIDGKKMGKLNSVYPYQDTDCECTRKSFSMGMGAIFNLNQGKYNYKAKDIKCRATNKINDWSGTFTIVSDECVTVYLDIRPEK